MLLELQNKSNSEIIGFKLMHFGFALELSETDLWNIDLLDTHLDLLDTGIPNKYFVSLHSLFNMSSRYVFKTSSRHVFKTSSRRLPRNNFSSSKTSTRRLERRKIVILKTSSRPTNVCWGTFPFIVWPSWGLLKHIETKVLTTCFYFI